MTAAPPIRVLLTEDVVADAELEMRELKRAGMRIAHRVAQTEESFVEALHDFDPDIILSDFSMPGFDGMAALALARELCPETPFIFVSGTIGEEYAIRALRNGATDYVLKTNLVRLPAAVERALADAHQRERLVRLSRIRDIASGVNSALVRLRERAALFEEICRIAVEVGRFSGAHVGLLGAGGTLEWMARRGTSVAHLKSATVSISEDMEKARTIGGRALRSGKPAVWNDVANDVDVPNRERFLQSGVAAVGAFPLVVEGRPIGLLGLHASEAGFFDDDEVSVLSELTANVSFALESIAKQDRITFLALYDPLTGLPNRTLFHERLTQAIEAAHRGGSALALALIDLERFKAINDTLGQQIGDRVLQAAAQRLKEAARNPDHVARLGNNLFASIITGIGSAEEVARSIDQAAAKMFAASFEVDGREVRLAAKAGIAVYPEDGGDADTLFRNAEASLQHAKETGERYLFYAPHINARLAEHVELEHRLRKAVEQGELFLHYQPKVDLASRRIVALEALMRWTSADGGLMSPAKFIPVLEQTGLILEAGRQVIAKATAKYRDWQERGLKPPRIAVNVSALQLRRKNFVQDVRAALGESSADGGGIDLEITESLLMTEADESIRKLRELREMGMQVALDDFGTGYSSLAYLSRLPLDTLKIDRGFVHGMTEKADDTSIVSAIISLAQALRLKVVAEGVETEQQAQLLRLLRCDQAQGYLFSPPVPAEKIETLL